MPHHTKSNKKTTPKKSNSGSETPSALTDRSHLKCDECSKKFKNKKQIKEHKKTPCCLICFHDVTGIKSAMQPKEFIKQYWCNYHLECFGLVCVLSCAKYTTRTATQKCYDC